MLFDVSLVYVIMPMNRRRKIMYCTINYRNQSNADSKLWSVKICSIFLQYKQSDEIYDSVIKQYV